MNDQKQSLPLEFRRLIIVSVVVLLVLALFLIMMFFNAAKENRYIGRDVAPQTTLTFQGQGEVVVVPDASEFSFSVQFESLEVSEAQDEVASLVNEIIEYLKQSGVSEEKIKTVSYSVFPRYENRPVSAIYDERIIWPNSERVLVGYEVVHTTRVVVDELERSGELVGGVGERGATNISGIIFTVSDEKEIKNVARRLAIEEAKREAEVVAKDLGVKLVRVVSFSENQPGFFTRMEMSKDSMQDYSVDQPVFSPGEEKIISTVIITYEIK